MKDTLLNRRTLFDALWLAALVIYVLAGTTLVPFHADESTQIAMSHDYAGLFIGRDLDAVAYRENPADPAQQELRLVNGTINKYLIGLAWHVNGFTEDDLNQPWDWGADWDYNQRTGHLPAGELLRAARWPSALLTAAGVVVMFALGREAGGRPAAYLASAYYALSPALLLNGRRAMMEGSLLFFSLLVVLAGVWFLRTYSWRTALLMGVAGGLALASKHTALFTVAVVFGGCLLAVVAGSILHPGGTLTYRAPTQLFVAGGLAAVVFLALNPAWWDDPVRRAEEVLELRQTLLEIQTSFFGHYDGLLEQVGGFVRQALVALPQYYEAAGWDDYVGDQITRYEATLWRGVSIGGLVFLALIIVGFVALWRVSSVPVSTRLLVAGWALAMIGFTLLLTPLEWQRYYVPVFPALGLLAALGLAYLLEVLWLRWRTG